MQGTLSQAPTYTWDAPNGGRGFWTKRRKTAASLLSVMTLLAGIAIAFSLFDTTVGDNVVRDAAVFDYTIEKWEQAVDDSDANPDIFGDAPNGSPDADEWKNTGDGAKIFAADGPAQYNGDTRQVRARISNTNIPSRDASFQVRITNVRVLNAGGVAVAPTRSVHKEFLSYWELQVTRQDVIIDQDGEDLGHPSSFSESCAGSVEELSDPNAPACNLGVIRGSDYSGSPFGLNPQSFSSRQYRFNLTEIDTGEDQSAYKGFSLKFDLVFEAKVPADPIPAGPGIR